MVTRQASETRVAGLNAKAIEELQAKIWGEIIRPGDEKYEATRRVYNAMIDRHPLVIVRCVDVADVIACVHFARENALPLAVRGGGHSSRRNTIHRICSASTRISVPRNKLSCVGTRVTGRTS